MLDRKVNHEIFRKALANADVAVIEGVMGLFDGASGIDEVGSTAEMAKWLGVPVLLVIDASAQARSAAALVHGFETFDPDLPIAGVIANRVAGQGHYDYIKEAIKASCKTALLGWLPPNDSIALPSRHLGLFTAAEVITEDWITSAINWVEKGIDLDHLLNIFKVSPASHIADSFKVSFQSNLKIRIGVAQDKAFCFYYNENLSLLESLGVDIIYWSPLKDALPDGLQGLYFGGGYPELYAAELSGNKKVRHSIKSFIDRGGVVYAECGGLMYLTEAIIDHQGNEHEMVGTIPTKARMHDRLTAIGYVEVEGANNSKFPGVGVRVRGHQFRYSKIDEPPESINRSYQMRIGRLPNKPLAEGYTVGSCLASYVHLHFLSNPVFAERFVNACRYSNVLTG
jgi:cobyrinic acid a,c-diamide synthase